LTRAYDEAVATARARARSLERALAAETRATVLAQRDEQLDAWWRSRILQQEQSFRARLPSDRNQTATVSKATPLPTEVRSEMYEALKAAPKADEELSELERRVAAQMREIAERGKRLASLEEDLAQARGELTNTTAARDALTRELQELAAQSAATRETLAAKMAAVQAELEHRGDASEVEALRTELERTRAELEKTRAEGERLRVEEVSAAAERSELERRLAIRSEELDTSIRQLAAVERAVAELERAMADLRAEAHEVRGERAELLERIDQLARHNDGLERALAEHERIEGELRAESLELAQLRPRLDQLERERAQTLEDLRRLGASRAWRMGHGVTRLLRRLTFRPIRTGGAVERMIARLQAPALPARRPESERDGGERHQQ
jgi:chromosome segregation ATPase